MGKELSVKILYLDQNHWITLTQAWKQPEHHPEAYSILEALVGTVEQRKIVVPLTATNIYETYKINDRSRRNDLATVQATLSGARVFVGRHARLVQELRNFFSDAFDLPKDSCPQHWFLSDIFFEAFGSPADGTAPYSVSQKLLDAIRSNLPYHLYDYWMSGISDRLRGRDVAQWSVGSDDLRRRIETRRERWKQEPIGMRRRAYGALLLIDELDTVLRVALKLGVPWASAQDIGSPAARKLMTNVPVFHVERELAVRLEAQERPLHENDFRDMAAFCATIPYADIIVGEKQFINLAHQAKLGELYNTKLLAKLEGLFALL